MGIDTDAKLVFGILLSWDDLKKVAGVVGVADELDMVYDDSEESAFCNMLGYACPWYNADCGDHIFYIGIGDEKENYTASDMVELGNGWEKTSYRKCLDKCGIAFEEPKMFALPHVF